MRKKKTWHFGIVLLKASGFTPFVDGVIYAVTFSVSILTGFLSATGLVVHEFAEGAITYLVFMQAEVKQRTAIFYALLIASFTTPLGAFIAYPFMNKFSESGLGLMLGFIAGVLIYISASHLLPEALGDKKEHSIFAVLGGVGLAIFIVVSKLL
jgi:zinc transporter ZupT